MKTWMVLHYSMAAKPSARRVYIWRKLKRLGAVMLQDAVWVLPDTPRTAEHFQWLVTEIQEMKGEAILCRSVPVLGVRVEALIEKFREAVDQDYAGLLKQLKRRNIDLAKLSRLYQQAHAKDYFGSELGREVRKKLLGLRGTA